MCGDREYYGTPPCFIKFQHRASWFLKALCIIWRCSMRGKPFLAASWAGRRAQGWLSSAPRASTSVCPGCPPNPTPPRELMFVSWRCVSSFSPCPSRSLRRLLRADAKPFPTGLEANALPNGFRRAYFFVRWEREWINARWKPPENQSQGWRGKGGVWWLNQQL